MAKTRRMHLSVSTAAAACFLFAPGALAQVQDPGSDDQLEEIVVTAQHRAASLQDVPIAVTAVQGEELARLGAADYTDIAGRIPNFSFNSLTNAGYTIPSLRGIGLTGSTESAISNNPATGVYIDGVYMASTAANLFSVLDVERVEVLRGPQGTLYGRNTVGGVINIISQAPSNEFLARGSVGAGSYNRTQVGLALSGPLAGDVLLGRIGATFIQQDGVTENAFDSPNPLARESDTDLDAIDSISTRASLAFRPTSAFELRLAADYSRDETTYPGYNVEDGASPDLSAFLGPDAGSYADTDGDVHRVSNNSNNEERAENWGAALSGELETGANTRLVSITGYRQSNYLDDLSDIDGTPINIFQQYLAVDEESFSQELRFHVDTDRLNAVFGLFHYDYEAEQDVANDILGVERDLGYPLTGGVGPGALGGSTTRSVVGISAQSQSAFAHAQFALSDAWSIEAGLRYTSTTMGFERAVSRSELGDASHPFYSGGNAYDDLPAGVTVVDFGNTFPEQERTFSRLTPKVGVTFQPTEDALLYASWTEGFREGGFAANPSTPSGILSFGNEVLTAYELGFKLDLYDRRLRLNGATYYYDYSDQQVEVATISSAGLLADILNSGASNARGFELEMSAAPFSNFELNATLGWQQTEFERLDAGALGDLSGNEFPRAPEWSASLAPTWTWALNSDLRFEFSPEARYQSEEFMTVVNDPLVRGDSRTIINATAALSAADDRWSLVLWANNVTDEKYVTKVIDLSTFFGYRLRRYGDPTTAGVTFNYNF